MADNEQLDDIDIAEMDILNARSIGFRHYAFADELPDDATTRQLRNGDFTFIAWANIDREPHMLVKTDGTGEYVGIRADWKRRRSDGQVMVNIANLKLGERFEGRMLAILTRHKATSGNEGQSGATA